MNKITPTIYGSKIPLNERGILNTPVPSVKGKAGSTTYAAIAGSIITTIKGRTDKEISHDTANALNTLSEIFDKKKIEEKQEYVNILSQVGYCLIGDIAGHKEVAGASYLYGTQENHERFKSPYNAFSADVLDVLPISAGM